MAVENLPIDVTKLPNPDFRAPDVIGTVEGWRAWQVSGKVPPFGASPKLYSIVHSQYYWIPRRVSIAECGKKKPCDREGGQGIPGEQCACGFYSAKTFDHLMTMGYHTYDGEVDGMYCIVGQVANWGKVIEGSLGWRAQKSYPVALYVPFEIWKLAPALTSAYGVKCKLRNFLKPAEAAI